MESINGKKSAMSFKTQTTHLTAHLAGVRHLTHLNISNLGSVWIQLKTKKHCSKIIFKCVNSTMGPIFNEKVAEK